MRAVLRTLFTSDFFKNASFNKIKSPAELVVSTCGWSWSRHSIPELREQIAMQPTYMGQRPADPPSVEGWHTGKSGLNSVRS